MRNWLISGAAATFAFIAGVVAGGGIFGAIPLNESDGRNFVVYNKLTGSAWRCALLTCVAVR